MTNETQNKFAAILAAAQAKANIQSFIPVTPVPENKPEPIPAIPEPEAIQPVQELSTMTVESLLNEDKPQVCAPSFFSMIKAYPKPVEDVKPAMQIVDYSPKSFAILTATKPTEDILNIDRKSVV